jgi:C_GCAxxG_C_C family probable redox protein
LQTISGAILVIGLKYGRSEAGDSATNDKTRALVRQFIDEFTEKNRSINCTGLLRYDLSNQENFDKARAENLFATRCPEYVRGAAAILERMI